MGQRGEIYSTRIFVDEGRKTFFFNVKENRFRDTYLNIVESRKTDTGFKRSSLVVFNEDIERFMKVFRAAIETLRARRPFDDETLTVGGGRRTYEFKSPPRGKKALQVTETRDDATGRRRESIIAPLDEMDAFVEGITKALSAMKSSQAPR